MLLNGETLAGHQNIKGSVVHINTINLNFLTFIVVLRGSVLKDHTSQNTSEQETTRVNTSQKFVNMSEHESKTDEHE